jgi:malonyl-CoA O-methyltransferase
MLYKLAQYFYRKKNPIESINNALAWLKVNHVKNGGIAVSNIQKISYPEVTGYLLPTLCEWGERKLARRMANWLVKSQNKDGSFSAPDGLPYVFDTGQVIRGLLSFAEDPKVKNTIRKACEYVLRNVERNGRMSTPHTEMWDELIDDRIHLYVLAPVIRAGQLLKKPHYRKVCQKVLKHYRLRTDLLDFNTRLHFYMYILEALYELGENKLAKNGFIKIAKLQNRNGSISAFSKQKWVCSAGLAQFCMLGFRLGFVRESEKALRFLEKIQNQSGGFFGSYRRGANFLPNEEISWAVKFFLDAEYWRIKSQFDYQSKQFPISISCDDGRLVEIVNSFGSLNGKKIIEVGCGKGRFTKQLHRLFPDANYYGLDISRGMLKWVPAYTKKIEASQLDIPFKENYFDFVYSVEALEHSVRPEAAISEMCRVLKNGGKIVIIDKNVDKLGKLGIEDWEQWFDPVVIKKILKKNKIQADYKFITYDQHLRPDEVFIAWIGVKIE